MTGDRVASAHREIADVLTDVELGVPVSAAFDAAMGLFGYGWEPSDDPATLAAAVRTIRTARWMASPRQVRAMWYAEAILSERIALLEWAARAAEE